MSETPQAPEWLRAIRGGLADAALASDALNHIHGLETRVEWLEERMEAALRCIDNGDDAGAVRNLYAPLSELPRPGVEADEETRANICPTCRSLHPDWDETGSRDFGQAVRRSKRHPAYRCPDPFHGETDPEHPRTRRAEDAEAIAYVSGVRDAAIDHDVEEAEALTRVLRLARAATQGDEGYQGPIIYGSEAIKAQRAEAVLRRIADRGCEARWSDYPDCLAASHVPEHDRCDPCNARAALQGDGPDRKDNTR